VALSVARGAYGSGETAMRRAVFLLTGEEDDANLLAARPPLARAAREAGAEMSTTVDGRNRHKC
jgi:hypothetical protein